MGKIVLFKKDFKKFHNVTFRDYNTIINLPVDPQDFDFKHKFKSLSSNQKEDFFIENYGNPLCSIKKYYSSLIVETEGNKLSLKLFNGLRERVVGNYYFKLKKNMKFISVNMETGDIYMGEMHDYHKKKKCIKKIKKNTFLGDPINEFRTNVKNIFSNFDVDGGVIFDQAILTFFKFLEPTNSVNSLTPSKKLIKFYLDKKNVKYPNNFGIYFSQWTHENFRKTLRKNNKKVVDTIMKLFGLQGKTIRKALHECKKLQVESLRNCLIFFKELIQNDYDLILEILNTSVNFESFPDSKIFTKTEMKRVLSIFKEVVQNQTINSYTFTDHMRMYSQLKDYGEDLKWMSEISGNVFTDEHLDWTNKLEYFKRGLYRRKYPRFMYESLKPIHVEGVTYFPILLDETYNYSEETNHQSNCVKTYIGRASSFIISLRLGDSFSEERATIEYRIVFLKNIGKVHLGRVQTLGRFNSQLGEEWALPIKKLDDIVMSWNFTEEDSIVSIEKECSNGVKFFTDSYFDENGVLRWKCNKDKNGISFEYNYWDL